MNLKLLRDATALPPSSWQLLPMRFHRFDSDSILLTNLVGEHLFVSQDQFLAVMEGTCDDQELLARLRARHLIQRQATGSQRSCWPSSSGPACVTCLTQPDCISSCSRFDASIRAGIARCPGSRPREASST